jgi:hypothetical protein
MKNTTLFLPGFHLQTLRRKPISAMEKLADKLAVLRKITVKQIGVLFQKYIPRKLLAQRPNGPMSRIRFFTRETTFWAFFGQILDPDGGCKEVVHKLQSYASARGIKVPSGSTASYCNARKKLSEHNLAEIFEHTTRHLRTTSGEGSINNRRVIVADGTGISMPDTPENQEAWPQSATQKPGCGFPTMRVCACFSLESGGLLSYRIGNKKSHELPLFRQQHGIFEPGDVFLADKAFSSYFDIDKLSQLGVDSVVTLKRRPPVSADKCVKKLGPDDLLIRWKRPVYSNTSSYSKEQWRQLPDQLVLRQIKVKVTRPGFRTEQFYIITTLLDNRLYTAQALAQLYLKRWEVELNLRDLKTTMGMDILRCKKPAMIRKELLMYFIAYNCIRKLISEVAPAKNLAVRQVSFKGCMQALRNWEPHLNQIMISRKTRLKMISDLYDAIVNTPVIKRPGRREPRCVKRRPKNYQYLTTHRSEMVEIKHRSRYRAKSA